MKNSGVLAWTQENIKNVPNTVGIFVLRSSPINGFIEILDKAEDLKKTLEDIYANQPYQNVQFFEWYQVEEGEDIEVILNELKLKYHFEPRS